MGTELLETLLDCYANKSESAERPAIKPNWTRSDFKKAMSFARTVEARPSCVNIDLKELKRYLTQKQPFLPGLLENPNLREHEIFTGLLWVTFGGGGVRDRKGAVLYCDRWQSDKKISANNSRLKEDVQA